MVIIKTPVTIKPETYHRLMLAEEACFAMLNWITYKPLRTMEDVRADWAARDTAHGALKEWAKLAQATANGGPE